MLTRDGFTLRGRHWKSRNKEREKQGSEILYWGWRKGESIATRAMEEQMDESCPSTPLGKTHRGITRLMQLTVEHKSITIVQLFLDSV